MPFKIERLPGESIIVTTWAEPANLTEEMPESWKKIDALIGPDEDKVYCITDLRGLSVDFSTMIKGMTLQRGRQPGSSSDLRIRSILVGTGMLWEIVSKGVKQIRGGNAELPLFSTMEEALAHAREKIKTW